MDRNYFAALAAAAVVAASPAQAEQVRSATWYANHPTVRVQVEALCTDNPGQAKHNPNCENVFQGDVIAADRAASGHVAGASDAMIGGAGNLGASVAYWRNPANAENRNFWKHQCDVAERQGASQGTLQGMWCPAIEASIR